MYRDPFRHEQLRSLLDYFAVLHLHVLPRFDRPLVVGLDTGSAEVVQNIYTQFTLLSSFPPPRGNLPPRTAHEFSEHHDYFLAFFFPLMHATQTTANRIICILRRVASMLSLPCLHVTSEGVKV